MADEVVRYGKSGIPVCTVCPGPGCFTCDHVKQFRLREMLAAPRIPVRAVEPVLVRDAETDQVYDVTRNTVEGKPTRRGKGWAERMFGQRGERD